MRAGFFQESRVQYTFGIIGGVAEETRVCAIDQSLRVAAGLRPLIDVGIDSYVRGWEKRRITCRCGGSGFRTRNNPPPPPPPPGGENMVGTSRLPTYDLLHPAALHPSDSRSAAPSRGRIGRLAIAGCSFPDPVFRRALSRASGQQISRAA